jgi:hypothetical protein
MTEAVSKSALACQLAPSGISTPSSAQRLIQSCIAYICEWGVRRAVPRINLGLPLRLIRQSD